LKPNPKTQPTAPRGTRTQILALAGGVLIAYALTCIVLIAAALLLTYTELPESAVPMIVTAACILSTIVAGFDAAHVSSRRGWLWGLAAGGLYALILICILTCVSGGLSLDTRKITLIALSLAGGVLGGAVGIYRQKR